MLLKFMLRAAFRGLFNEALQVKQLASRFQWPLRAAVFALEPIFEIRGCSNNTPPLIIRPLI